MILSASYTHGHKKKESMSDNSKGEKNNLRRARGWQSHGWTFSQKVQFAWEQT